LDDAAHFDAHQIGHSSKNAEVYMRKKHAGLGLIIVVAVAAVAIWGKSPAFTGQAQAIAGATQGISPHELQLRIDTKGLPVQEIGDPI
jgi:hypothetical protein